MSNLPPPPSAMTTEDFKSPQWQAWFRYLYKQSASVSVGLTMPANTFTVSGSPVLNNGTFGVTLNSQAQGTFFAAPAIGSGTPTWRTIQDSDISSANTLLWLSFGL